MSKKTENTAPHDGVRELTLQEYEIVSGGDGDGDGDGGGDGAGDTNNDSSTYEGFGGGGSPGGRTNQNPGGW